MAGAAPSSALLRRTPIDGIESEGGSGLERTLGLRRLAAIGAGGPSRTGGSGGRPGDGR